MNIPVANWREEVGPTSIFWDLADRMLRLYGPRSAWGVLTRQAVGPATLFSGAVSFGYQQADVAALAQHFAGKRLAPLVASSIRPSVTLAVNAPAPHIANLSMTPSVPFPDLQFTATIQNDAALADLIAQKWADRSLLTGSVDFIYDMRSAIGGFIATVDYQACAAWLAAQVGFAQGVTAEAAVTSIAAYLAANEAALVEFVGMGELQADRDRVVATLAELLFKGIMVETGTLVVYDNGEKLSRWDVHSARSLIAPTKRMFVQTSDVSLPISLVFP